MNQYLPFLVIGLTTGSVYALAAVGLVLTYKTSRIFNFAHGSVATVSVLLFFALVNRAGIPWHLAFVLDLIVIGPLMGLVLQLLGSRLTPLSTTAKVLATIGLVLFVSGAVTLWGRQAFGSTPPREEPTLPGALLRIGGVNVGVDQIIIIGVGLVVTLCLHLVIERTRLGRSMRAVVDAPELLALSGRRPATAQRAAWAIGIGFVTLSGLLFVLSPSNDVPVQNLSLLVLQAFGAAAVGGFRSLPLTYAGGLGIGVASALVTKWSAPVPVLGGLPPALPFLVLFLVLVAVPRYLAPQSDIRAQPVRGRVIEVHRFWRVPLAAAVAAALIAVPLTHSVQLVYTANEGLAYAVIFLGLGLLVRTSGQVSLCQMGLAAIGAAVFAHTLDNFGVPWLGAVLLGGLAAAAVGAVVAIPAIRVAGVYLAIATFGFGVLLEQFLYPTRFVFSTGQLTARRPSLGPLHGSDQNTYFVVLVLFVGVAAAIVAGIRRARLGRLLRGLADAPVALEAQGASVDLTRVAVFVISAFLAGIGGALLVSQLTFLEPTPFGSTNSLIIVVVLMAMRLTEPVASLAAAAAFVVVPTFLSPTGSVWWLDIGFGTAAVVAALAESARWLPRWRWARPVISHRRATPVASEVRMTTRERVLGDPTTQKGLELRDVVVRYKGIVAVNHLSLLVPMGQVTGLIGPNGAGKTTTFNFCSGLVRADSGRLFLHGRDITLLGPPGRARRGIGRTFQQAALFESLSVRENVELGAEAKHTGANVLTHVLAAPKQKAEAATHAEEAIETVGIGALASRDVRTLSTSERRLVELARCLAGDFDILLLDEPSAGLDAAETARFGQLLDDVCRRHGLGILLVEHNMPLVLDICSDVYVLDFGELLFQGAPSDVASSETVRAAYLGVGLSETHSLPS